MGDKTDGKPETRFVTINGNFTEDIVSSTMKRILKLEQDNPIKDIVLVIDSYGGAVDGLLAIHDIMQLSRCDIATVCVGKAMSAAQMLLMSGEPGKRFITKNSRIMVHAVGSIIYGKIHELDNSVEETKRLQKVLEGLISDYTKLKKKDIKEFMEKDTYLTANQAKKHGFVDHVIKTHKDFYKHLNL